MNEQELERLEQNVKQRFRNNFDMSEHAIDFVINMVASFHSTRGGALYDIDDYFDRKNMD